MGMSQADSANWMRFAEFLGSGLPPFLALRAKPIEKL